jgi:hypothetical protein
MISAKDLRVGVWVEVDNNSMGFKNEIVCVEQILKHDVSREFGIIANGKFIPLSQLNGIRIAEEILLKCGCIANEPDENGNVNYWNKEKDFSVDMELLRTPNGIESIFYYVICGNREKQIQYVHKFQNLHYELRGEELIINL